MTSDLALGILALVIVVALAGAGLANGLDWLSRRRAERLRGSWKRVL